MGLDKDALGLTQEGLQSSFIFFRLKLWMGSDPGIWDLGSRLHTCRKKIRV